MYAGGGGKTVLSSFSLGIIPFINASIIIDLLTALFPYLEKLQSEEGEMGRKKIMFYKKVLTLIFAAFQSIVLLSYIKPYIYNTDLFNLGMFVIELITGAMAIVWLTTLIDNRGIGTGTSCIICLNIVTNINAKGLWNQKFDGLFFLQIFVLLLFVLFIQFSQVIRTNIQVVSARQLSYLENTNKSSSPSENLERAMLGLTENGLSIRLNQAGIFPIIIASNLSPFISYLTQNLGQNNQILNTIVYYFLIIAFNYFYTIVFWDPEKIAEQLRKASVSIVNVTPGKQTVSYLEAVVLANSVIGGILLCFLLFSFDFLKQLINGYLLNQINISSLIILIGVTYEIQKTIRSLIPTSSNEIN
jgi:preprotein translocase subunit SecY